MIINTTSLPFDVAIQRIHSLAASMTAAATKTPRREQGFGDQLARAVQDRLPAAKRAPVIADNHDGDFGEELTKAIVQQLGGSPAEKRQAERERERARYKQPQPRKRTKG